MNESAVLETIQSFRRPLRDPSDPRKEDIHEFSFFLPSASSLIEISWIMAFSPDHKCGRGHQGCAMRRRRRTTCSGQSERWVQLRSSSDHSQRKNSGESRGCTLGGLADSVGTAPMALLFYSWPQRIATTLPSDGSIEHGGFIEPSDIIHLKMNVRLVPVILERPSS